MKYRNLDQYKELHESNEEYGASGGEYVNEISLMINFLKPKTVLDYGCGKGKLLDLLKKKYPNVKFYGFDPAMEKFKNLEVDNVDFVINTDVLEHIPENELPQLIYDISKLSKNVFFALHHAKATTFLPNGENAHCTVRPHEWYLKLLGKYFKSLTSFNGEYKYLSAVCTFDVPFFVKMKYKWIIYRKKHSKL